MTPFLKKAVQELKQKHNRFDDVTIILPSKRAKVFLIDHLLQLNDASQFAPEIFSIEEFVVNLSQLKLASQNQQLYLLYQAYLGITLKEEIEDFESFMIWGKRLLKDFNDIDAYQVKAEDILSNLGEYYALESPVSEREKTSFSPLFWKSLPTLFNHFSQLLQAQLLGTMGMLYKDALETLEVYLSNTSRHHYFIGFNALNRSEEYLFQEFLIAKKGTALWDLDQHFYRDKIHAAGRFIQRYQKQWNYYRQFPTSFNENNFSLEKEINAIGFSGNISQAKYVGVLLEQLNIKKGSTAVVLGNETMLLPTLGSLPETMNNWNVTMGYPIENLPIVQFFLSYLEVYNSYNTDEGFLLDSMNKLLSFDHFLIFYEKENKAKISTYIHRFKSGYSKRVKESELRIFNTTELSFFDSKMVQETSAFLLHIIELINSLTTAYRNKKDNQIVFSALSLLREVMQQIFDEVSNLPFSISVGAIMGIFKEELKKRTIDFKGNPIEGVQIMGMLETRGLDFDHVIITNVNEGVLPVGKNDQSFFPFAMKKYFGLPTFLDNDAIYTYHFYRLLQRAKSIFLLYNAKSEGLNAGEKSRFITQLTHLTHPSHQFSDHLFQQKIPIYITQDIVVEKTKTMINKLKKIAGTGFSPTSLSCYLVDPHDFYQKYVLGINPKELPNKILSHRQRGTIIHQVLENLYTPHLNKIMLPVDYDQMIGQVESEILSLYSVEYPVENIPKGENKLILAAYQRAIIQFLGHEKCLVEAGNELIILSLEKQFSTPLENNLFPFPVVIGGKIDRVDQFNGQLRLIDYKTGVVISSKLQLKNWDDFYGDRKYQPMFQLLLYAWAMQKELNQKFPFEAGVVSLKSPFLGVMKISKKATDKTSYKYHLDDSLMKDFEQFLTSLLKEIFEEKKSFVSLRKEDK